MYSHTPRSISRVPYQQFSSLGRKILPRWSPYSNFARVVQPAPAVTTGYAYAPYYVTPAYATGGYAPGTSAAAAGGTMFGKFFGIGLLVFLSVAGVSALLAVSLVLGLNSQATPATEAPETTIPPAMSTEAMPATEAPETTIPPAMSTAETTAVPESTTSPLQTEITTVPATATSAETTAALSTAESTAASTATEATTATTAETEATTATTAETEATTATTAETEATTATTAEITTPEATTTTEAITETTTEVCPKPIGTIPNYTKYDPGDGTAKDEPTYVPCGWTVEGSKAMTNGDNKGVQPNGDSCTQLCLSTANCLAFEYDQGYGACYLHYQCDSYEPAGTVNPFVIHFIKDDPGCP